MSRKRPSPDRTHEDRALWHKVTESITPLPKAARLKVQPPAVPDAPPPQAQAPQAPPKKLTAPTALKAPPTLAPLPALAPHPKTGQQAGLDAATLAKFQAGKLHIAARLDLHGMTLDMAHHALSRFIKDSYHNGRRCVIVVTGKGSAQKGPDGKGLIQSNAPRWLKAEPLRPLILSLCPAKPKDGGDGALYVLLKRRR